MKCRHCQNDVETKRRWLFDGSQKITIVICKTCKSFYRDDDSFKVPEYKPFDWLDKRILVDDGSTNGQIVMEVE